MELKAQKHHQENRKKGQKCLRNFEAEINKKKIGNLPIQPNLQSCELSLSISSIQSPHLKGQKSLGQSQLKLLDFQKAIQKLNSQISSLSENKIHVTYNESQAGNMQLQNRLIDFGFYQQLSKHQVKFLRHNQEYSASIYLVRVKQTTQESNINFLSLLVEFLELINKSMHEVKLFLPETNQYARLFRQNRLQVMLFTRVKTNQKKMFEQISQIQKYNNVFEVRSLQNELEHQPLLDYSIHQLQFIFQNKLKNFKNFETQCLYQKLMNIYTMLGQGNFFMNNPSSFQQIQQTIMHVATNIQVYYECVDLLIKILHLFQYKAFQKQQIIKLICPQLTSTINRIICKLQLPNIHYLFNFFMLNARKHNISTQNQQNQFLQNFVTATRILFRREQTSFDEDVLKIFQNIADNIADKILTISKKNSSEKIKESYLTLHKILSQKSACLQTQRSGLSDAVDRILSGIGQKLEILNFQSNYNRILSDHFFQNIEQEELPNSACICCSSFFYIGHSITDNSVRKTPLATFSTIKQLQQFQKLLLPTICSFLNGGGGVILLDTKKQLHRQLAVGQQIDEQMKSVITGKINKMVELHINPCPDLQKMIRVDFVPLCINPLKNKKQPVVQSAEQIDSSDRRLFVNGIHMTRIRVCPRQTESLYCVKIEQQQKYFINELGTLKQLDHQLISKVRKEKESRFLGNSLHQAQEFGYVMQEPADFFGHDCQNIVYNPSWVKVQKQCQKQSQPANKQFVYKQMFMIVAKQKSLASIKKKLVDKGYKCSIQLKFHQQKFKSTKHTALLYIDAQFQQVLKNISFNKEFQFNNKNLLTIRVRKHLKLDKREAGNLFPQEFFRNVMQWVGKVLPNQLIQVYEYHYTHGIQYYLQTQSKTACLLMYYLLNHLHEKCSFKQPKGFQQFHQLSQQELRQRWRKIYSSASL